MRLNRPAAGFIRSVQITMALLYIAMGVFVLSFDTFLQYFPAAVQYIFGGLCIIYGIFRLYRSFRPQPDQEIQDQ